MLLSSNVALIGGNSTKPGSSYYALIKAVLSLLIRHTPTPSRPCHRAVGSFGFYLNLGLVTRVQSQGKHSSSATWVQTWGIQGATCARIPNSKTNIYIKKQMYQHMYIFLMPMAMHCTGRVECTPLVGLSRSLAHVFCGGFCFVHIAARQNTSALLVFPRGAARRRWAEAPRFGRYYLISLPPLAVSKSMFLLLFMPCVATSIRCSKANAGKAHA